LPTHHPQSNPQYLADPGSTSLPTHVGELEMSTRAQDTPEWDIPLHGDIMSSATPHIPTLSPSGLQAITTLPVLAEPCMYDH
jgi:hypothetical protein